MDVLVVILLIYAFIKTPKWLTVLVSCLRESVEEGDNKNNK